MQFLVVTLWVLMLSVTLVESDAYRYAAIVLIFYALFGSVREEKYFPGDWLAALCVLSGTVVITRFIIDLAMTGERGASEWLYAFPILFPFLGSALIKSWHASKGVFFAFFLLAMIMIIVSTQWVPIANGERGFPLFHHNPIHGAVGCGFLLVGAFYWAAHHYEVGSSRTTRAVVSIIASIIIPLALFNIYGSKSKGVWLALIPALILMFLSIFMYLRVKTALIVVVIGLVLLCGSIYWVSDHLVDVVGPTVKSTMSMIKNFDGGSSVFTVLEQTTASQDTPPSMNERLQLWSNALEVIAAAPVFGSGNGWLTLWHSTHYAAIPYTLLHNGYFEILVRHGLFGLIISGVIFLTGLHRVHRASSQGIISKSACACYVTCAIFFAFTILSNSNNRLALGESFALLFGAVCFACSKMMRLGLASHDDGVSSRGHQEVLLYPLRTPIKRKGMRHDR
ncbi:O-antigen ligase family protein [Rhizobium sp. Leaf262]|uniref:O-antigen ligase family protein n=1 Tax=Rhizobium sp. Leaf262 TaxID=1736312 RepID=UPI0009E78218|nr:O-antigen ligase family protein [Rhizobium sp. Leaf262]